MKVRRSVIASIPFLLFLMVTPVEVAFGAECTRPAAGLVSWWTGDGTAKDSRGTNHGILRNGATPTATGKVLQGFGLNGTNSYIEVPETRSITPGFGSFSIDAWVKTSDGKPTGQIIAAKVECDGTCPSGGANSFYFLYIASGRLVGWTRARSGLDTSAVGTRFIADGKFHHVALVRDVVAGTLEIFIDGTLEKSAPLAGGDRYIGDEDGSPDSLLIGAEFQTYTPINFFNGVIDEVGFYSAALSSFDVADTFRAGSAGRCDETTCMDIGIATFSPTGSMSISRFFHTATPLADGKVLISGGSSGRADLATAEIYNPATGTFSPTGSMSTRRSAHTATPLADGKVLISGGSSGRADLATAEIYNPATGTFSLTGSMSTRRHAHTATPLADGKVLISGGSDSDSAVLATAEIYNPATGTFSPTGSMSTSRYHHTATPLADGKVLISGGNSGSAVLATAEIYNPATGTFSPTGSMSTSRYHHTATPLADGKVLISGGNDSDSATLATAEIYNPATGTFSPTGSMSTSRRYHTATPLADGKVLISGGSSGSAILATAEIYNPATGTFSPTGSMSTSRYLHTATPLADGKVLISGGISGSAILATAEIYNTTNCDTTPPNTLLDTVPSAASTSATATFTFHSTETPSTFQCSLDDASFTACASPLTYNNLSNSSHTFQVRATDQAGNVDPTPATYTWSVDARQTPARRRP